MFPSNTDKSENARIEVLDCGKLKLIEFWLRVFFKHISSNPNHHMKCWQWYKWQWLCRKQLQSSFWYFPTNIDDVFGDLKERSYIESLLISKIHKQLKIRNNCGNSKSCVNFFMIKHSNFHAPVTQRFREVIICFLS